MITRDKMTHNSNCKVEVTSVSSRDLYFSLSGLALFVNTSQDKVHYHNTISPQHNAILRADLKRRPEEAFSFICSVNIYELPITCQALEKVSK